MKILTIGGATQDVFIGYEDAETMHLHSKTSSESYVLLKEGGKIEVKQLIYSSGGGANNAAISFKRQGFEKVATIVKIGSDEQGAFVLKKLREEGVLTDLVIQAPGQTGISFIIPSLSGDRTIFAFRGLNGTITHDEIPFNELAHFNYLYVTSLSGASSQLLFSISQEAKKHRIRVATNPGTSQLVAGAPILIQSLPFLDILILNSSEAKTLMLSLAQANAITSSAKEKTARPALPKPELLNVIEVEDLWFSLNSFFQAILSRGPSIVVVTNGKEGVYVATKEAMYFHPSLSTPVVNTLGAGDAFGSSFVGSLAVGKTVEQAIRYGIINAASVISFMDTKQGLLSLQEMEQRALKLDPSLLQKFALKD